MDTIDATRQPVVTIRDGEIFADSRNVAAYFGKEHRRVLQTIRELNCSDDFRRHNFVPFKIKDLTGEHTSHVEMTKDGFAFLAMGFTGGKAAAFKEAYIKQFNVMEAELRNRPVAMPDLSDPVILTQLLLEHANGRIEAEKRAVAAETRALEMKKDVDTLTRVTGSDELFGVRVVAKLLNMPEKKFTAYLQQKRWAYRQIGTSHLLCYADKQQAGYCRNVGTPYPKADGTMGIRDTLKFYPKGVFRLAAALNVEITHADLFGVRAQG